MKKLILAVLLGIFTVSAFADRTARSMRTPQGQIVLLGDSEYSLLQKMGKPRPVFYVLNDGKFYCSATQYTYRIDLQEYDVIACNGTVVKIILRNL